jgi:hypothetical protein
MDPDVAPFESNITSIALEVNIALLGIFEVSEKHKTMSGSYAIFVSWNDDRMMWNPSSYQNISTVQVKAQKIWIPTSVCLFNEIGNENCIAADKGTVTVYSSGYVVNRIFKENTIRCDIDVTKYPFDSQACFLQFVNVNTGTEYITFDDTNSNLHLHYYEKSEVWDIVSTTAHVYEIKKRSRRYGKTVDFQNGVTEKIFPCSHIYILTCKYFIGVKFVLLFATN